jgi:hypothetical protein
MSDVDLDGPDEPMTLRAKIAAGVVLTVVLLASLFLMLRMGSPAITTSRTAPSGHYPLPCAVCHTVTAEPLKGVTP